MSKPTEDNVLDMHRQTSITFLRSTPAYAVRTPRGQKDPGTVRWDAKANTREKSDQTIATIETTNDNLGVHLFGSVVDVDVDTDNPFMSYALDYFLPPTGHVWGRPSRPRTHRLYQLGGQIDAFDPHMFPFLAKIQACEAINVEVRGGEQKSAQYSLLPGSMHPSGEAYQWEDLKAARATPATVDVFRLLDGVRLACVAALIAPHWVEGVRNELCKALSGFMHKAAKFSEELNMDLSFDYDMAKRLMEGLVSITGDEEDAQMRIRTFEQTWEKGDAGAPILGATHIERITGEDGILPMLYILLVNTPDMQQLEEMFQQYVVLRNTTTVVDLNLGSSGNYTMHKDAFTFTLAGQYLNTPKGRIPLASVFLNSLQRTIVDHIGLNPSEDKIYSNDKGQKVANVWSGWGIEPWPEHVANEEVEVVTSYLYEVLCREDPAQYEWLIAWLSDIFKNPGSKPGTALVIVGQEGAGKSVLPEVILRPIVGSAHFAKGSSIERLTSKFNSHMSGKLVIEGEEVLNTNRRADAEAMKDAVTSAIRTVEKKGIDSYEMEDYARYILISNHIDNAVAISTTDRRYTFLHASTKYADKSVLTTKEQKREFFNRLFGWCQTEVEGGRIEPNRENLAKLHKWFLQQEFPRHIVRSAIDTEVKAATKANSSRGLDKWLLSMVECENPFELMRENDRSGASFVLDQKGRFQATEGWPTHVVYTRLEQSLKQATVRDYGEARSAQQLAKFFKETGMLENTDAKQTSFAGTRVKVRPFPSKEAMRGYLNAMGFMLEDDIETSADTTDDGDDQPDF